MTDLRSVPLPRLAPGPVTGETLQPYLELLVREVLSKADVRRSIGNGVTITATGDTVATLDVMTAINSAVDTHDADATVHTAAFDAHKAEANPHPTYLTQAEGDALYEPTASILPVTTVGALPAAAPGNQGVRSMVTDANSTTFLATAVAGGTNIVPVISNGTNWIIA